MARRTLRSQLFPSFLIIMVLALIGATWFATAAFRRFHRGEVLSLLTVRARFAATRIAEPLAARDYGAIGRQVAELDGIANTRYTVVLPSGEVVADSREDPGQMEVHAGRPEIIEAFAGGIGVNTRFSHTLGRYMIYVAVPIEAGDISAVVRASVPLTDVRQALQDVYVQLGLAVLAIAITAAGLSYLVARRLTRPLEHIREATGRFAAGDFSLHLTPPAVQELAELAEAVNSMAEQLDERIRSLTRERNEHHAILASMSEGVIAVDAQGRVLSLNEAAATILGVDARKGQGRTVEELFRSRDMQEFVRQVLDASAPMEKDVVLAGCVEDRYVRLHGATLHPEAGLPAGAVLVLRDVTQLRRLENIQRGFVANASHELKTPVTTIKGFVETLLAGAIEEPEQARRFLGIIARQSDRLAAIIDDILDLTRIEEQHERGRILREVRRLRPLLTEAIELCQLAAAEKQVTVEMQCPEELAASVNGSLLEQALVNLIHNAVKYSPEGEKVEVAARAANRAIQITVEDEGPGIAREHLDRIFERFYVVDTARSRKLGGTGLGLAIVKHVAAAHGGTISVDSALGRGSTFTLSLPRTV